MRLHRGNGYAFGEFAASAAERAGMSYHDGWRLTDARYLDTGEDVTGEEGSMLADLGSDSPIEPKWIGGRL